MIFIVYYKNKEEENFIRNKHLSRVGVEEIQPGIGVVKHSYKRDTTYFFTGYLYLSQTVIIRSRGYTAIICLPESSRHAMHIYTGKYGHFRRYGAVTKTLTIRLPMEKICKKLSHGLNQLILTIDSLNYAQR